MSESGNGFVRKEVFETVVAAIREDVSEIKDGIKWQNRQFITVCIAFIAFMALQLYHNIQVRAGTPAYAAERVVKQGVK